MSKHPKKLTIREAAAYSGFEIPQVGHAAKTGRLVGYKAGPYGPWYFTEPDLDSWISSMRSVPAQPEAEETPAPVRPSRRRTKAMAGAR